MIYWWLILSHVIVAFVAALYGAKNGYNLAWREVRKIIGK